MNLLSLFGLLASWEAAGMLPLFLPLLAAGKGKASGIRVKWIGVRCVCGNQTVFQRSGRKKCFTQKNPSNKYNTYTHRER